MDKVIRHRVVEIAGWCASISVFSIGGEDRHDVR